jgi:hypothetical protein
MIEDERTGEIFLRIVGRRTAPPLGEPPPRESREALAAMAQYRTRAPKGIFIYRNHEEAPGDLGRREAARPLPRR